MIARVVIPVALGLTASVAWADLRPAPGSFLDTVVAASTAQQLALACPILSINPGVITEASSQVMARLEDEGFDITREDLGMEDATAAIRARQNAFLEKHGLFDGAPTADVCASGISEIAEATAIGQFLLEVPE